MVIHVECATTAQLTTINRKQIVNELAEPSCPQWVATTGLTNASQQWGTRIWGFHTVPAGIVPVDNRFRPRFVGVVHV